MQKRTRLIIFAAVAGLTAFAAGLMLNSWANTADASTANATSKAAVVAAQPASVTSSNLDTSMLDEILAQMPGDTTELATMVESFASAAAGPGGFGPFGGTDSPEAQGVITKVEVSGATIKLTVNGRRIVTLNDQTVVGDATSTLKKEDLKQGDRIVVLGKVESDQSLTARYALRQPALPTVLSGAVSAVASGNTIKFKVGKDNAEWSATTTATTKITKDGKDIKLSDLTVGDRILVVGKADKDKKTIEATSVSTGKPQMPNPGNAVRGKIKSVDTAGNSFVVTDANNADVKVTVDSTTKYGGSNVKALADLKVGDTIIVVGNKQADGSVKATGVGSGAFGPGGFGPGGPRDRKPGGFGGPGGPPQGGKTDA